LRQRNQRVRQVPRERTGVTLMRARMASFRIASFVTVALVAGLALDGLAARATAQEKVFKSMTTEQIEQLFNKLKIEFKKTPSRTAKDVFYYDFTPKGHAMRLHFFGGKDVMLDSLYKEYPLETLNRWNTQAKFSRAALH